jgi:hypothetical protein
MRLPLTGMVVLGTSLAASPPAEANYKVNDDAVSSHGANPSMHAA